MDSALSSLSSCEKLSLSTDMITNIQNLQNLKCLKILSLGRNLIKNVAGKFEFRIPKNDRGDIFVRPGSCGRNVGAAVDFLQ